MGLKCSVLGHSFEPADFEREREEQGSEVVTVVREIERCVRCGEQRVVSESTEVTAVVDEADVDLEGGDAADRGAGATTDAPGMETSAGADAGAGTGTDAAAGPTDDGGTFEARDPAEEDAEILTDDEPGREPGAWPEEPDESWDPDAPRDGSGDDDGVETTVAETTAADVDGGPDDDGDDAPVAPTEEALSGITVPEGTIVCTECEFSVDAESSYRDGDPCPDCGAWLTSERNR